MNKPELHAWNDIWEFMNQKKAFLFENEVTFFCIPINAKSVLKKAIKNSHKTHTFVIEDAVKDEEQLEQAMKDWSIISKGILARKDPISLKITFTKINKINTPFITDVIRNSVIDAVVFYDCTFEDGSFDSLCKAISESTSLKTIVLTTNELTEGQLVIIEDIISKQGKSLLLHSSEIRSISDLKQINDIPLDDYNRYIFEWVAELTLSSLNVEDPRLCYAVKMSPCLQSIIISSNNQYSWKWMKNAIIENKSIHRIKLLVDGSQTSNNENLFNDIMDIFAKTNITVFEIAESAFGERKATVGLATLILSNRSLKHLTLTNCFNDNNQAIIDAVAQHNSITSLTLKLAHVKSDQIKALLKQNPKISSLTIIRGSISTNPTRLKRMFVRTLKELHLQNCLMTGGTFIRDLTELIPKCKYLQAFSYTDTEVLREPFKEVVSHSSIQKINICNITLVPDDTKALLYKLMTHQSITSFAFNLTKDYVKEFANVLRQNTIFRHVGISFDRKTFDQDDIEELKGAIQNNGKLLSFMFTTEKFSEIALDLIGGSKSITSFDYRTEHWTEKEQRRFFKQAAKVLEHNQVISKIVIHKMEHPFLNSAVQMDPAIQKLLKRNKDQRLYNANNILYLIGVMVAKPKPYLSLLPLEVWSNIFSQFSVPGVALDFGSFLLKQLENKYHDSMDSKNIISTLPGDIIARILMFTPISSTINFYSVNSTHLKLFDDQHGLWEQLTKKITKNDTMESAVDEAESSNQDNIMHNWKKEFRVVSYFNSIIRENPIRSEDQPQNTPIIPKNHIKTNNNSKSDVNRDYICFQSDLRLYPLPEGNFKTAYFEVDVLECPESDNIFFIGGALEGYSGPVGHGRSSYGYCSNGSIYVECEFSPEDDPATAVFDHYTAHHYEVDEHLNPIRTDRKIRAGDTVGFGINFAKNAIFFTKNGKHAYETKETFATHPQKYMSEPLANLKNLHATLSLRNNMEVVVNTGSSPFKFDLIEYQHKKDPQPSWYRERPAPPDLRPYYEIILEHLTAIPDEDPLEFEFRYEPKFFVADYNPPSDPSSISPVVYALTYGKVPTAGHNINKELIATYESWRKIIVAKNVPILADKPTEDIRRVVERLSDEFELWFHPYGPYKDKIEKVLDIVKDKLGPILFDILADSVEQIRELTFSGNKVSRKYGTMLLAVYEYFRTERPERCNWMKSAAAAFLTDGRSSWSSHNNAEYMYDVAIGTIMKCRVHLGMRARVLQQYKSMVETKLYELKQMKHVFINDEDMIMKYEKTIAKLINESESANKWELFPLFRRQKDIEQALNGKTGTLKKQSIVFYGVYGLNISPNEYDTIDDYLREVAAQNRKLLTDPMKKEYLEYLLKLTRDLQIDDKFSGNLAYKIERPMSAVFGAEMELPTNPKQEMSPEESKIAAIQCIQQEIDKIPIVEIESSRSNSAPYPRSDPTPSLSLPRVIIIGTVAFAMISIAFSYIAIRKK